jgi:hypothetical protein
MRTQEADDLSLWYVLVQGAGKRMVVDRQKIINKVRVQEVQSGRQARGQGGQYGQAGGFRVRAGKGQTQGDYQKRDKKKQEHGKPH